MKSPILTDTETPVVVKLTLGPKVGVVAPVAVVLRKMETLPLKAFATAKSGLPSPFKSLMLTD